MSAARHANDANNEALRLHLAVQRMCEKSMLGVAPTHEELGALLRGSIGVQYHTARTMHAVSQFHVADRRELVAVVPTLVEVSA